MPFRIAVDAINLAADRRGMGRYVRDILAHWENDPELAVALLDRSTMKAAARDGFDAVWYPWNGIRFTARARKVVVMHDAFAFTQAHPNAIARWREQAPIRRAAREADAFATVSNWSADELSRELGVARDRFTIVSGVPDAFWQPIPPDGRAPFVLVVGGPEERKNTRMLREAFARAFPRGEAVLIDTAEAKPTDLELRALYANALAVAVPSYAEGYGLPAVEAMACGAPVLAADAAGLPEACDGAAMLLPPNDVEAWASALREMRDDSTSRGRSRAKSLVRVQRIDRTAPARLTLALLRGGVGSNASIDSASLRSG
jgi:glycosyltransferase involved in cell wall biosynthesis